jgi:hypothetical protein
VSLLCEIALAFTEKMNKRRSSEPRTEPRTEPTITPVWFEWEDTGPTGFDDVVEECSVEVEVEVEVGKVVRCDGWVRVEGRVDVVVEGSAGVEEGVAGVDGTADVGEGVAGMVGVKVDSVGGDVADCAVEDNPP